MEQPVYKNKNFYEKLAYSDSLVKLIKEDILQENGFAVRDKCDDSPYVAKGGVAFRVTDLEAIHTTYKRYYIEVKDIGRTGMWDFQGLPKVYIDNLIKRVDNDLEKTIIVWIDNETNPIQWRAEKDNLSLSEVFKRMNPKFCTLQNGKFNFVPYCQKLSVLMQNRKTEYEGTNPRTGRLWIPCRLGGRYKNQEQYIWPVSVMEEASTFFKNLNLTLSEL